MARSKSIKPFIQGETLLLNPVAASRPRVGRWGTYYNEPYQSWRDEAKTALTKWARQTRHKQLTGPLVVWASFRVKRPKSTILDAPKGDVDNFAKGFLDAANEVLWEDDNQIRILIADKEWSDVDYGYITFSISPYKAHTTHDRYFS